MSQSYEAVSMQMNIQKLILTLIIGASGLAGSVARAEELVREFRGERAMQTAEFEVKAPWILDWRVTGEYAEDMAVDVSLVKAGFNVHEGNVLKARSPGNGVRLFDQGGRFLFRVDSTLAAWTLRVYQLTPEEAKLYTPRTGSGLDY